MSSDLVFQRDTYDLPLLLFERSAVDRGLSRWRHIAWRTEATDLSGATVRGQATLAELFAVVDERELPPDKPAVVGFRHD